MWTIAIGYGQYSRWQKKAHDTAAYVKVESGHAKIDYLLLNRYGAEIHQDICVENMKTSHVADI